MDAVKEGRSLMGRHRKKKSRENNNKDYGTVEMPLITPENIDQITLIEPLPKEVRDAIYKPDRQPTRGESLRYYEYTIHGRG